MTQPPPTPPPSRHPRDGFKPDPTWLTTAEAAAALGLSPRTLEKWRQNGRGRQRGPAFEKYDEYWVFYTPAAIAAYRRSISQTVTPPTPAPTKRSRGTK